MKTPQIHLVLTDDWELRGDGSGDMRHMQFATIRKLVSIYDEFGLKGTFMPEVMQQLYHRKAGKVHPELATLADEWEATLREVFAQGHDVQMHLHPQWNGAHYQGGVWNLSSPWAFADYSAAEVWSMLANAKNYLEELLRTVDPVYRCCAFRAGAWLAFPCDHLLKTLTDLGIAADLSIVPGWHIDSVFHGNRLFADYRKVEERFLPYYPSSKDPLQRGPQGLVHCVPTHTFFVGPVQKIQRRAMKALGIGQDRFKAPNAEAPPGAGGNIYDRRASSNITTLGWKEKIAGLGAPSLRIADLSALSVWETDIMLAHIRSEARKSSWSEVPVVIANHTKDIGDFEPIRQFAKKVASADDIQVITLRALCDNLSARRYPLQSPNSSACEIVPQPA